MKKVLIVKSSSLGDIIHAFPVVAFLRQEFAQVKIDWLVEKSFAEIVRAHPGVDRVIEMDTKGWRKKIWHPRIWSELLAFRRSLQETYYDLVIDLQGNTKSAVPTFFAYAKAKVGFGYKMIHEWPNLLVTTHRYNPPFYLNVRDENLFLVQHFFERYTAVKEEKLVLRLNQMQQKLFDEVLAKIEDPKGQKILICPGSAWRNKRLSYEALENFLGKLLENQDVSIILAWGTAEELEMVTRLNQKLGEKTAILERMPLPVLQNLMGKMDLVIAMDSLPLHLAGTVGVKTFSVFGASSAEKYKPLGFSHYTIQGPCPYGISFERRCPKLRSCPTGLCIQGMNGENLFEKFKTITSK